MILTLTLKVSFQLTFSGRVAFSIYTSSCSSFSKMMPYSSTSPPTTAEAVFIILPSVSLPSVRITILPELSGGIIESPRLTASSIFVDCVSTSVMTPAYDLSFVTNWSIIDSSPKATTPNRSFPLIFFTSLEIYLLISSILSLLLSDTSTTNIVVCLTALTGILM